MIIKDFKEILERFPEESKKPIKNNELAYKMRNDFTQDFEDFVFGLASNSDKYSVKISPGMGRWTNRPWAGIKNSDATNTFQEGLYLIYIFNLDKNGFYLSLDQGNDTPIKFQRNISNYLINIVKNNLSTPLGFISDKTKLYESTILSKFYNIDEVTIDELQNDLKSLMEIYEYLIPYYNEYCDENNIYSSESYGESGIGDEDVQIVKYWLISPGEGARLWDEFYNNGIVGIGMSGTGDLSKYSSKDELKFKFQEIFNDKSSHMHDVHASWQFVHEMKIGDIIYAKQGMGKIIGRGIIKSDYEYNLDGSYHNIRKVQWTNKGDWPYESSKLPMKTLTDITNDTQMLNNIKELITESGDVIVDPPEDPTQNIL